MDSPRGMPIDSPPRVRGHSVGHPSAVSGMFMGFRRMPRGLSAWTPHGLSVHCSWTVHERSRDCPWTPHGLSMTGHGQPEGCTRTVHRLSIDCSRTVHGLPVSWPLRRCMRPAHVLLVGRRWSARGASVGGPWRIHRQCVPWGDHGDS